MVGRRWDPGEQKKGQRIAALRASIRGRPSGALRALMRGRRKQSVYAFVVIQQMSLANTTDVGRGEYGVLYFNNVGPQLGPRIKKVDVDLCLYVKKIYGKFHRIWTCSF